MTHTDALSAVRTPAYSPFSEGTADAHRSPPEAEWSLAQRAGFRFLLVYLALYTYPGPLNELPFMDLLSDSYAAVWRIVVPWVGAHVLRLAHPVSTQLSGSSDKLFDWVQVFTMLALAAIAAVVWSVADRRSRSHTKLFAAFRLYLRFTLAATLFSYGFDKVLPNQFSPMSPARLTQVIGEASPGGFAWTFLGFSIGYEVFAGAGEVVAATLLLFRRTTTLGAIVGAAILSNVFMLNMSFDIPVKQYSGHLLLMCVLLLAYDAKRLVNVLVRDRGVEPPRRIELFAAGRPRLLAQVAGTALGLWIVIGHFQSEWDFLHSPFGRLAPHGPLYGIFEVDEVVKNGVVQPPLLTDSTRWRRFATSTGGALVRLATDSVVPFRLMTDSTRHRATFTSGRDTTSHIVFSYAFADSMHLRFAGRVGVDSVEMRFHRRPDSSYLLVSRGFHWINETPYFR